jgi:endonuclease/exonuclease/phosphatase family metal-dependent hydrolase
MTMPTTAPSPPAQTLRVATLNIWNRFGPWDERLVAIRAGVEALAPDILGLQEVVRLEPDDGDGLDQGAAIAQGFGYHVAYGRARDERWFGNAILSRWPIGRTHVYELPRVGTEERRVLLYAEIAAPFGTVPFFVTHLNWKFDEGHVREAQMREVVSRVAALAPAEGFPAILVGDMNAEPDADEIRYLRGLTTLGTGKSAYFQDAFGIAGDGSAGFTYTRRNPFSGPLREPDRRIDYVWVRGRDEGHRGEPLEARVVFDAPVNGTFPSDHFGVLATLRVR